MPCRDVLKSTSLYVFLTWMEPCPYRMLSLYVYTYRSGGGRGGGVVWQRWKKSVCFSMSHWRRLSCIPLHIPSSRVHPLQTNRKKKHRKETWTSSPLPRPPSNHTHTHTQTVTCTVAPAVSHSSASHTGRLGLPQKGFCFHRQKKNVRATFVVSVFVPYSFSSPPAGEQLESSLPLSVFLSSPPPVSVSTPGSWASARVPVHFQKQGKGSGSVFHFLCVCFSPSGYFRAVLVDLWRLWSESGSSSLQSECCFTGNINKRKH